MFSWAFVGVFGGVLRGVLEGGLRGVLWVFCGRFVDVLEGACGCFVGYFEGCFDWCFEGRLGGLPRGAMKGYGPRSWNRVGSAGIGRVRHRVAIWQNILIDPPKFGRKLRTLTYILAIRPIV